MPLHRVADLDDPRVAIFRDVPDPELMRRHGLFVAEGRLVVQRLLESTRFRIRAVLVTETVLPVLRDAIERRGASAAHGDPLDVFVTPPGGLELGGFNFHRGCLALGERPAPAPGLDELGLDAPAALPGRRIVLGLEGVANADNVGALFRNAAAFGVHAVVLDSRSCDPLYRKATRTSMGATLSLPFLTAANWRETLQALRTRGYALLALTPGPGAIDITVAAAQLASQPRIVVIAGSEGAGLDDETLALADHRVSIAMAPGIDSLNVATATGIVLHRLFSPPVHFRSDSAPN